MEPVEILIRRTGQPDRVVRFGEGNVRIGRAEDNEIVLSDVGVSRRHAQVRIQSGSVTVQDLQSGNGTYHDGKKVDAYEVQTGDEIVIDPFVLTFRLQRGPASARPPAQSYARLEVLAGKGLAASGYPIPPRGLTMGRSEDRDVVIPDPASSRHHCSVLLQNGEYLLRDMGSANGVFVDNHRVRDQVLNDGAIIRIGNTEFRFVRTEGSEGEATTQVQTGRPPGPPRAAPGAADPTALDDPPPPTRRSWAPAILLAILLLLAIFALLTVTGLGLASVVAYNLYASDIRWPPATEPTWVIELPPGLPESSIHDLFEAGVAKMQAGDNAGALHDFYRVLLVEPGNPTAETFAFAAGEFLVLDQLGRALPAERAAAAARDTRRDTLLAAARGPKRGARSELISDFSDDPVVREALGPDLPDPLAELLTRAEEARAAHQCGKAAADYEKVKSLTRAPDRAKAAAAGLNACRAEAAAAAATAWRRAIVLETLDGPGAAEAAWYKVLEADPKNPSARLHSYGS